MTYLQKLFSLNGRAAMVTGAARGNGRAISEALLKAGAHVVLIDVLAEELNTTVKAFRARRLKAHGVVCDLTDGSAIESAVRAAEKLAGPIHVLVNNAGITLPHAEGEYPDDKWEQTLRVNLSAPFKLARAVSRGMIKRKRGSIINITSLNAELAFPDNPAYMAAKGGLRQLTKSLAYDLGPFGIRVNNIGPGYFKTNMTKGSWSDPDKRKQRAGRTLLGRWGEPSDLAGAVIFLASDASSYVTGQDLYVDGGWMVKGM